MSVFWVDRGKIFSYADLLREVNARKDYCPLLKTQDTYALWVNFVTAVAHGAPLTLIDSDISSHECSAKDGVQIDKSVPVSERKFSSVDELIEEVSNSKSRITIFTSGTTGRPKSAIHTIGSLSRMVRRGDLYASNRWAFAYNPTHMAGLQVFLQAFFNRNALVNVFGASRAVIYEVVEQYGITHVSATPTFYRLLLPYEHPCASVERVTLGGEKSDETLYSQLRKIFPNAKLNNVYASTEAGSLFSAKGDCFQFPKDGEDKFKVVGEELFIHKSMLGSLSGLILKEDFYPSGDLIEWVDEKEGLFRFKGRKDEMINVGGYKVNPGEVERVLLSIDGITQAMVYGRKNSVLGNILCADIQLDATSELDEIVIKKMLREWLQDFKVPRKIKFVSDFALTRSGKLKRL